jgi:hypothetical protein
MSEHTDRRDPASQVAVDSRNAIAGVIARMFPGAVLSMAYAPSLNAAVVVLPLDAGRVSVRSTTAGTEDVEFKVGVWPVGYALESLAVLALAWDERLRYLQDVAAKAK